MQYVLAVIFAGLGGWLWVYVFRAIAAGLVMRPMHTPWFGQREPRNYDRSLEPVRYWMTVVAWIVLAILASASVTGRFKTSQSALRLGNRKTTKEDH